MGSKSSLLVILYVQCNYANLCEKSPLSSSKSVNKAPKILIFGLNILWMAFLAIILEKNAGIKIYFLCHFYKFYEFLMYFFAFLTFCFCCVFRRNLKCRALFEALIMLKQIQFQPLRVKISIFIWTMWKNSIMQWFMYTNITCVEEKKP